MDDLLNTIVSVLELDLPIIGIADMSERVDIFAALFWLEKHLATEGGDGLCRLVFGSAVVFALGVVQEEGWGSV